MTEQIKQIVKKYKLYEPNTNKGKIAVGNTPLIKKNPDDMEFIKANKPAILDYLRAEREAEIKRIEESAAKQKAWESSIGLDKLKAAIKEQIAYKEAFDKAWERGDGKYPAKPEDRTAEMAAMYPIAAAYHKAENWSLAANYAKANAGHKAMHRIEAGEDHKKVIADMENEWSAHCEKHIWD